MLPSLKDGVCTIVPSYKSPNINKLSTPTYMLWNKSFISYITKRSIAMKYLSIKYKNKMDLTSIKSFRFAPNLASEYKEKLIEDINDRLPKASLSENHGMILSNEGPLIEVVGSNVKMNIPEIKFDGRIPYLDNEILCYDLLRLMKYYF